MIKEAVKRGAPIPAPYDDPPFYHEGMTIFMLAFKDLNGDRSVGADTIPRIKRREIIEWANDYGYSEDDDFKGELIAHIRELDETWINIEIERRKRASKKRSGKSSNGKENVTPRLRPKAESVRRRHSEATE